MTPQEYHSVCGEREADMTGLETTDIMGDIRYLFYTSGKVCYDIQELKSDRRDRQ